MSRTNKQLSSCLFVQANTDILTLPDSMSYALKLADWALTSLPMGESSAH